MRDILKRIKNIPEEVEDNLDDTILHHDLSVKKIVYKRC
jgi:hypothetical protein